MKKKKYTTEGLTKDTPFEEVLAAITPMIKRISNDTNGVYGVEREDLEQELRLQAFKSWQSWDPNAGTKFSTYVYDALMKQKNYIVRTAKAQCRNRGMQPPSLDEMRDKSQSSSEEFCLYDITASDSFSSCDPETYLNLCEIHEVIDSTIDSMRERAQEVVRYVLEGYTQTEVSEMTGVTQSLVSYHLNLFRSKLRRELERRDLMSFEK